MAQMELYHHLWRKKLSSMNVLENDSLSNGLKFHTLSRHLGYGKQVFPQENPSAQFYAFFNVCLYTNKQREPVVKHCGIRLGKAPELTDFPHRTGGSKDTPSNWNLELFFSWLGRVCVETSCTTKMAAALMKNCI